VTAPNAIQAAVRAGRKARGVHLSFPAPEVIEILAPLGLDFVLIDGQHGAFGLREVDALCRTAENLGVMPIARPPDLATATIGRFLDRGIRGILGPRIGSGADARRLVEACLFPPEGQRSHSGARSERHGALDALAGHYTAANDQMWIGAIASLDEILSVGRIDHFAIGRFDLALSLGQAPDATEVAGAVAEIERRVHAAGRRMRDDDVTFAWDRDILRAGAARLLAS
jgi:4-hydroxy-2-oxoheptanedioate aldolase